jgi:hypothetical protein
MMSSLDDRRRSRDLFKVGVLLLAELSVGYLLCYYLLGEIVYL